MFLRWGSVTISARPLMPLSLFGAHRMMGIARSSVVCFVIDTTGSMSDDIDAVKKLIHKLIDDKRGTQDEPSEYILVPFNDPGMNFTSSRIMFGKPLEVLVCDNIIYNSNI